MSHAILAYKSTASTPTPSFLLLFVFFSFSPFCLPHVCSPRSPRLHRAALTSATARPFFPSPYTPPSLESSVTLSTSAVWSSGYLAVVCRPSDLLRHLPCRRWHRTPIVFPCPGTQRPRRLASPLITLHHHRSTTMLDSPCNSRRQNQTLPLIHICTLFCFPHPLSMEVTRALSNLA